MVEEWELRYLSSSSVQGIKSVELFNMLGISSVDKRVILTIMKHNSLKICCARYPIKLRKVWMTATKSIIIESK
jgi:hypothetical protein